MTTIIVVAIVALVFFVTICVVAFMVWKQQTEKRTDSLKGIEDSLHDVLLELYGNNGRRSFACEDIYDQFEEVCPTYRYGGSKVKKDRGRTEKNKKRDPFKWMRSEREEDDVIVFKPDKEHVDKLRWKEIKESDIPVASEVLIEETLEVVSADKNQEEKVTVQEVHQETHKEGLGDLAMIDILEDMEFFGELQEKHADYNVGRSGKKYTAEELEELIKE